MGGDGGATARGGAITLILRRKTRLHGVVTLLDLSVTVKEARRKRLLPLGLMGTTTVVKQRGYAADVCMSRVWKGKDGSSFVGLRRQGLRTDDRRHVFEGKERGSFTLGLFFLKCGLIDWD